MALDPRFHRIAHEYIGLIMADSEAREEVIGFPDHDKHREEYHRRLRELVNRRLGANLPAEAASDFHRHVYESLKPYRDNMRKHIKDEETFILVCDGYHCRECILP
jgi:hypothetical protein